MDMVYILMFTFMMIIFKGAKCKDYYDCTSDDCSFFDSPVDPRNDYTNLFLQVESGLNKTIAIPSWEIWLQFYDGYLSVNINEFTDECACPLVSKEDKVLVTFHSRDMLDIWYSYKLPASRDMDGAVQLSCAYTFSAVLVNQTNQPLAFQKIDVTSLYVFNFNPYGAPLEWMEDLPLKFKKLFEKALYNPVKSLLEDTLLRAFNEQLRII